jgi:hypothetical protein
MPRIIQFWPSRQHGTRQISPGPVHIDLSSLEGFIGSLNLGFDDFPIHPVRPPSPQGFDQRIFHGQSDVDLWSLGRCNNLKPSFTGRGG